MLASFGGGAFRLALFAAILARRLRAMPTAAFRSFLTAAFLPGTRPVLVLATAAARCFLTAAFLPGTRPVLVLATAAARCFLIAAFLVAFVAMVSPLSFCVRVRGTHNETVETDNPRRQCSRSRRERSEGIRERAGGGARARCPAGIMGNHEFPGVTHQ